MKTLPEKGSVLKTGHASANYVTVDFSSRNEKRLRTSAEFVRDRLSPQHTKTTTDLQVLGQSNILTVAQNVAKLSADIVSMRNFLSPQHL